MRLKLWGFEVEVGLWAAFVRVPGVGEGFIGRGLTAWSSWREVRAVGGPMAAP